MEKLAHTYTFFEQLFTSTLQALAALLNQLPLVQHPIHRRVYLVYALYEAVASLEMFRHALKVGAVVSFLAMCDRPVDKREPVIELLWCLDGLFWVESIRRRAARESRVWCTRPRAAS